MKKYSRKNLMSEQDALAIGAKAIKKNMVVDFPTHYEFEWFRIVCKDFREIINEMAEDMAIDRETLFDEFGGGDRTKYFASLNKEIRAYWKKEHKNV